MEKFELLNYAELETALLEVAAICNHRPLTVRVYDDDTFFPVSPADLLLGKMSGYRGTQAREEGSPTLSERVEKVGRFVQGWWTNWQNSAFQLFTPRGKWCQRVRNLVVGDVVLLQADSKLQKGVYRLAVVEELHPDEWDRVRTVTLALQDRRKRGAIPEAHRVRMASPQQESEKM